MSGVATIVEIIALTKKKLKAVGATTEETARTPKELGLSEMWLKTCLHSGVATTDGRYYLKSQKP